MSRFSIIDIYYSRDVRWYNWENTLKNVPISLKVKQTLIVTFQHSKFHLMLVLFIEKCTTILN